MKISLSHEVELLLAEQLQSGRYQSAEEVVREGLALLQEREREKGSPTNSSGNFAAAFVRIAGAVPDADWEKVPADLSRNLDSYLYDSHKTS